MKNDMESEQDPTPSTFYSQKTSAYEDREDQLTHQSSGLSVASESQVMSEQSETTTDAQTEEMINLYTCDFAEFANHMAAQYGREQFAKGYDVIQKNKDLIYTEEGEEQLVKMLRHLFKSDDVIRGFLNFCTSYIIVQNYSQNIQSQ